MKIKIALSLTILTLILMFFSCKKESILDNSFAKDNSSINIKDDFIAEAQIDTVYIGEFVCDSFHYSKPCLGHIFLSENLSFDLFKVTNSLLENESYVFKNMNDSILGSPFNWRNLYFRHYLGDNSNYSYSDIIDMSFIETLNFLGGRHKGKIFTYTEDCIITNNDLSVLDLESSSSMNKGCSGGNYFKNINFSDNLNCFTTTINSEYSCGVYINISNYFYKL